MEPNTQPKIADGSTRQAPTPTIKPGAVARDVLIVWVLSAIGGFIVGLTGVSLTSDRGMLAMGVANILLVTGSFVIAGCLTPANRWRQLAWVAFFSWLTGIVNVLFLGYKLSNWIASAPFIAVLAALGGAISLLIRKSPVSAS